MQKSEALFTRAQKTIPGGVNSPVRAFKAVGDFISSCSHLLAAGGTLLAMKGPAEREIPTLKGFKLKVHELHVPGSSVGRYLLEIRK